MSQTQDIQTNRHTIQAFLWVDYNATRGHKYTYRIVTMRGSKEDLVQSEEVSIWVETDKENIRIHEVYFNRGVAAPQAYANTTHKKPPDKLAESLSVAIYRAR